MPVAYLDVLSGARRSALGNRHLGVLRAFVALPPVWRDLRIGARLRVSLARCRSAASRRR
jgi:hypothetical protein